jgi:hypothetical protein
MRFLMIAAAATPLLLPAAAAVKACGNAWQSTKAASTDYSAAQRKKRIKTTMRMRKEKVEYMRAGPMK